MASESSRKDNTLTKRRIVLYLLTTSFAFILLWLAAMKYLTFFDAVIFFLTIICLDIGIIRGGIKEFFGFFGALASLMIALHGYRLLWKKINFDFGGTANLWAELGCFILLLGICWLICYIFSHFLQKKIERVKILTVFNRCFGFSIGFIKGFIFSYIVITVIVITGIANRHIFWERQLHFSYCYQMVNILENNYHILDNLAKMELAQKLQIMHEKTRMHNITSTLFPDDSEAQDKAMKFLLWLAGDNENVNKLNQSKEAIKIFEKFLQLPEGKTFWDKEPITNLKKQEKITIFDICEILRSPACIDLAKKDSVKLLLKAADLEKIKLEVEHP